MTTGELERLRTLAADGEHAAGPALPGGLAHPPTALGDDPDPVEVVDRAGRGQRRDLSQRVSGEEVGLRLAEPLRPASEAQ